MDRLLPFPENSATPPRPRSPYTFRRAATKRNVATRRAGGASAIHCTRENPTPAPNARIGLFPENLGRPPQVLGRGCGARRGCWRVRPGVPPFGVAITGLCPDRGRHGGRPSRRNRGPGETGAPPLMFLPSHGAGAGLGSAPRRLDPVSLRQPHRNRFTDNEGDSTTSSPFRRS
jgi:hypothetical protein